MRNEVKNNTIDIMLREEMTFAELEQLTRENENLQLINFDNYVVILDLETDHQYEYCQKSLSDYYAKRSV